MRRNNHYIAAATVFIATAIAMTGLFGIYHKKSPAAAFNNTGPDNGLEYRNDQYGFTVTLPADWQGYTIATTTWTGYADCQTGQCPAQTGPEIMIRNPQWTPQNNWQPIPIMIFTLNEWSEVASATLIVSAAPILPDELGQNTSYVFALPPRYDYAFPEGWQEVEAIMRSDPLNAF